MGAFGRRLCPPSQPLSVFAYICNPAELASIAASYALLSVAKRELHFLSPLPPVIASVNATVLHDTVARRERCRTPSRTPCTPQSSCGRPTCATTGVSGARNPTALETPPMLLLGTNHLNLHSSSFILGPHGHAWSAMPRNTRGVGHRHATARRGKSGKKYSL